MASRSVSKKCLRFSVSGSLSDAFLKLTSSRSISSKSAFHPPLDFLLPNAAIKKLPPGRTSFITSPRTPRTFYTSELRRATNTVVNPRKDDDGNEMTIEITPRASNRLREIMEKDSNSDLALRITVESGGCHGFQYLMSLTTLPPLKNPSSTIAEETSLALRPSAADPNAVSPPPKENEPITFNEEDDTVFEAADGSGARVVLDGSSLELLKGSKVDYTMELIGSQFKIVDNPLATSSCGCGTSFDIKD